MRFTVCEQVSPAIKSLIEEHYIPWYCDVDNSTEWYAYASGLGPFTLPMICIIDPADNSVYIDRTTSVQYADDFYTRLQPRVATPMRHIFLPALPAILLNRQTEEAEGEDSQ